MKLDKLTSLLIDHCNGLFVYLTDAEREIALEFIAEKIGKIGTICEWSGNEIMELLIFAAENIDDPHTYDCVIPAGPIEDANFFEAVRTWH